MDASRRAARLLLWCYPATLRRQFSADLEEAFVACVHRERVRLGPIGVAYAWLRGALDAVSSGARARWHERRQARAIGVRKAGPLEGDSPMESLIQDARYALRGFLRAPALTFVIVVTLAFGIGANTALFTVVDAVLLRPLRYPDSDRLALVYERIPRAFPGPIGFSAPDFTNFAQRTRSFDRVAAFQNKEYELSGIDRPARVIGARVSAALFDVLRTQPALGRAFTDEEDRTARRVVILNDGLWRREFGADPSIVGRAIHIDRQPYDVVGVMPRGFTFPSAGPVFNNKPADLYVPISFTDFELRAFGSMYNNSAIGRLAANVTVDRANAEAAQVIGALVDEVYPAAMRGGRFTLSGSVASFQEEVAGRVRTPLGIMMAAVFAVLLIACADIANLMLTRAATRRREMAVRTALGASRWRLTRHVLVESFTLAIAGAALGLVLARAVTMLLVRYAPMEVPRAGEIALDMRALGFTMLLAALTAVLFGIVPAIEAARRTENDTLKEGARGSTFSRGQRRVFGALIATQFALAIVLLVTGGLLVRSLTRLLSTDPGFNPQHVFSLKTSLPVDAYQTAPQIRSFYAGMLDEVGALPGVSAVGAATNLPLGIRERRSFSLEAPSPAVADLPRVVAHDWVAGRYFDALGIELRGGRYFTDGDAAGRERVVIVNETMARRFWPGEDPIGRRVKWGGQNSRAPWMTTVGVVADVKQGALNTETEVQTYTPYSQLSDGEVADNIVGALRSLNVIVRTTTEPGALVASVREVARRRDPALPVSDVRMLDEVIDQSAAAERFSAFLLASFAGVALVLAALGVGGVLAASVSRRTHEIGVRVALGARGGDVVRLVVGEGMRLAAIGLVIGLAGSFAATRAIRTMLFGVGPRDPWTFVATSALLLAVALIACYVPARRATRVNPTVALRYE